MLTEDLKLSNNPKDVDRSEILDDVNVACRTTVDILNDLLCFDKMESGILIAHKHEVNALSFITECVGMFSAQAREGDVTISVVNGDGQGRNPNLPKGISNPCLLDSDKVFIDRFKMDQVLRNLISNALKFTPRGGAVTVSASFVPFVPTPKTTNNTMRESFGGKTPPSGHSSRQSVASYRNSFSFRNSFSKSAARISAGDPDSDVEAGSANRSSRSVFALDMRGSDIALHLKGNLVIVVKDSGAGMVEENYSRLFKEIIQFNPEVLQAGGGSGLGLWITKGIVDLHNGKVSVHSEGLGLGSSFTVELAMERSPLLLFPFSEESRDSFYYNNSKSERCVVAEIAGNLIHSSRFVASEVEMKSGRSSTSSRHAIQELEANSTRSNPSIRHITQDGEGKSFHSIHSVRSAPSISHMLHDAEAKSDPSIRSNASNRLMDGDGKSNSANPSIRLSPSEVEQRSTSAAKFETNTVASNEQPSKPVYNLLVVDDSPLNRKMLIRTFRAAGHICDEAEDGLKAVIKVKEKMSSDSSSYSAILMDFVMPNMDGPTATKEIRALGYVAPIFGVTGNALDYDVDYFIRCGANNVLAKPLEMINFERAMEDCLASVVTRVE